MAGGVLVADPVQSWHPYPVRMAEVRSRLVPVHDVLECGRPGDDAVGGMARRGSLMTSEQAESYVAPRWSAGDTDPEASELHQRAARARWELRRMCEDDPYLIVTELEDAVRTLARRPLEEERDRLRGLLRQMHAAGEVDGRNALIARADAAETQVAELLDFVEKWRDGVGGNAVITPFMREFREDANRALAETSERDGS